MADMHQQVDPPLSLYESCPLSKTKDSFGHKSFRSASFKVINLYGRSFLERLFTLRRTVPSLVLVLRHSRAQQIDLSLSFFLNSCLIYLFSPFSLQGFSYHCDYHSDRDYLFTLSKGKSTFFYYYYYYYYHHHHHHVCMPQLIRSNSSCQGHVLGK